MHMGMLPQYLTNTLALFTEVEMGVLHPIYNRSKALQDGHAVPTS